MLRLVLKITAALLAVVLLYLGITFAQVWMTSRHDTAQPAGAIVVMGAAQYGGRPSAVFRARLDHTADLYREGYAEIVVVTGGRQLGDTNTEAQAAAAYLAADGVPQEAILRENDGRNSWEQLAATRRILAARGIDEVIVVSDPYHSYRVEAIAEEVGLDAHVSPTETSPTRGLAAFRAMLRETAAVSVGRIISYRRLMRVDETVRVRGR
jgi:uncharacterized SAM-binding protein YcdF (DUF218 family)